MLSLPGWPTPAHQAKHHFVAIKMVPGPDFVIPAKIGTSR